jgi:hypothetical protein
LGLGVKEGSIEDVRRAGEFAGLGSPASGQLL